MFELATRVKSFPLRPNA